MVIESFPTIRAPFAVLTLIEKHVEKNRFVLKVKKKLLKTGTPTWNWNYKKYYLACIPVVF